MKNKKVKSLINQIHLWLGLISGIVVFVISISGFIYVFEEEIRDYTQAPYLEVPLQKSPFVGVGKIIDAFEAQSTEPLGSIKLWPSKTNATVQVITTKKKVFFFNPYDARPIHSQKADWLNTVFDLHTSLLLGESGKIIQGWSVVVFLIMLITGLILWFPNQRRLLKQSLSIKWGGSFKRVNFDLHQVLGFYGSIILIVIALTGTYFAFSGVKFAVEFVTGSKIQKGKKNTNESVEVRGNTAQRYQAMYDQLIPYISKSASATFAKRKSGEFRVRLIYPYGWSRKQNTFFFDESTAVLLRSKLYEDNTRADWYEATNYDLHTGRLFGYFGKILWSIASLIGASLPITGFIIWYRKIQRPKNVKKQTKPAR